ncbi:MAG: FAD-binding oxidoreductase [Pseudomonadota bacterium]|nr:FAD-binding oxidoreductase [Pseudomonadota bacterium]
MDPITDPGILDGYLTDASNLHGRASGLYRPRTPEEVAEVLAACQRTGTPVTVVARRTSTTGAPVPDGGVILSTEHLDRVHALDDVDAGVLLGEYQAGVERQGWMFTPDPTSRNECTVGGAIACNASGARTFKYGPTRPWVEAVQLVTPTGEIRWIDRTTPLPWPLPAWDEPKVKTAAGYYPATNLLDLIIGAEGTLGVVTRARLKLLPLPAAVLTVFTYFPDRASMLAFVVTARTMGPRCIEYFDRHSLDLIRGRVPAVPVADSAILLEIEHDGEPPLDAWFEALAAHGALLDDTIVADDDAGRAKLHAVRHALPATVNEIIARNGVQKVGTDFAVPAAALAEMMAAYDQPAQGSGAIATVCFGHIGDSHLHLNFLPNDAVELAEARRRYLALAQKAVALGGTVSAEHGIGRLKKAHLALMAPPAVIDGWRAYKRAADPNWILGRGVMFDR